jgi:transcriptional regulator with GAF, ATPase, and Fis domain
VDTTRDHSIIRSLVEMADNLVDNFDVVDLLTGLTDRCVRLLGVSAAGVMLSNQGNELRLIASSSETMQVVELFELQADEGPCLDAFRTGEPVQHETLAEGTGRWPRFALIALGAGFHSVSALPLRLREHTIGALNLFSVGRDPMDERDVMVARGFADLATISVLQHGQSAEAHKVSQQLHDALASRIVIEQAKGVISERAGIDMTEAFDRLRDYARRHGLRLTDIALRAIEGTLDASVWESPSPRTG